MRSAAAGALAVAGTSCTTAFSALLLKKACLQTVPGTEAILARQTASNAGGQIIVVRIVIVLVGQT